MKTKCYLSVICPFCFAIAGFFTACDSVSDRSLSEPKAYELSSRPNRMTDRGLLERRYYLWQDCEKRFKRSSALSYYAVSAFGFPLADLDGTIESINEERTDESGGYLIYPLEIISEGHAKISKRIDGDQKPRFYITVLEIEKNYFLCDIDAQVDGSMGSYSIYVILRSCLKKCYDSYSGQWKDMPVIEKIARIEEPEYIKIFELVRQYKKHNKM